mmetsp:Transcript_63865/g.106192  ORF Transcript_63865/g.106192 Transcript_63865/m.106192 type:complete len:353 (+) Transcript_63865:149-1207(+)|eukprot:CAMPEP_0119305272 /NCGR_PEP_ID=MMETSP1333-20130426/6310_1 /TAXON_ID=418940 /ORGANISM="Scyphosphaera apsteinii, Strain RCC1455" /LENGTH=352 /DNA_ID=CAMNT_0007308327 /DNA_START=149 /DNA_END=1207 /DNA_ORIENTATION=-
MLARASHVCRLQRILGAQTELTRPSAHVKVLRIWSLLAHAAAPLCASGAVVAVVLPFSRFEAIFPQILWLLTAVVPVGWHLLLLAQGRKHAASYVGCVGLIACQAVRCFLRCRLLSTDEITRNLASHPWALTALGSFAAGVAVGAQPIPELRRACVLGVVVLLGGVEATGSYIRTADARALSVLPTTTTLTMVLGGLLGAKRWWERLDCAAAANELEGMVEQLGETRDRWLEAEQRWESATAREESWRVLHDNAMRASLNMSRDARLRAECESRRGGNRGNAAKAGDERALCLVCLESQTQVAFFPCGHKCVCMECANAWVSRIQYFEQAGGKIKCPYCNTNASSYQRIYDP